MHPSRRPGSLSPESHGRGATHLAIALVAIGIIAAAWLEAGLAFDGSSYLARALEARAPHVPFQRYSSEVLQYPVLIVGWYTENLDVLRHVYAATLALVPLVAVGMSWLVVRHRSPGLMVWPVLGIGLVVLPGLLYQVSESVMVAELIWPLLLLVLIGSDLREMTGACVLAAFVLFLSASAALAFVVLAVIAGVKAACLRHGRGSAAAMAAVFMVLAAIRLVLLRADVVARSHELSGSTLLRYFDAAERGWPFAAVLAAWCAGLAVTWSRILAQRGLAKQAAAARLFAPTLALLGGLFLLRWALEPGVWPLGVLDARDLVLPLELPLVALAAFDHLRRGQNEGQAAIGRTRAGVMIMASATVATVLTMTSASWSSAVSTLAQRVNRSSAACVTPAALARKEPLLQGWWLGTLVVVEAPSRRLSHAALPLSGCRLLARRDLLQLGGPSGGRFVVHAVWAPGGWFKIVHLGSLARTDLHEAPRNHSGPARHDLLRVP